MLENNSKIIQNSENVRNGLGELRREFEIIGKQFENYFKMVRK